MALVPRFTALRTLALAVGIALYQIAFGLPTAAYAAPLFAVELDFGGIDERSSEPLARSSEFFSPIVNGNFFFETMFGAAERGSLRASAHGNIFFPDMREVGTASVRTRGDAIVFFRLDDVIITGPGDSIETVLNLHFSGGASANAFARNRDGARSEASASARVGVRAIVNGVSFEGSQQTFSSADAGTLIGTSGSEATGILDGFVGDGDLVSPLLVLPVGRDFTVFLELDVQAFTEVVFCVDVLVGTCPGLGGLPVDRRAEAHSSFASTLSFPLSGPVFDLPDGFTVNSVSGLIVDNQWVGAQAVPEPSGAALLGLGLLSLLGLLHRRRSLARGAGFQAGRTQAHGS